MTYENSIRVQLDHPPTFDDVIERRLSKSNADTSEEMEALRRKRSREKLDPENAIVVISTCNVGDILLMVGAIRYLATQADLVYFPVSKGFNRTKEIFKDDPRIIPFDMEHHLVVQIPSNYALAGSLMDIKVPYKILKNTHWAQYDIDDYPACLYEPLGIPLSIMKDYHWIAPSTSRTPLIPTDANKTMLMHCGCSLGGDMFSIEDAEKHIGFSRDNVFVVNVGESVYPESHRWYTQSKEWAGLDILRYRDLIRTADYIVVTDSCFFCLSLLVNPSTSECYRHDRPNQYWCHYYLKTDHSRHGQSDPKPFKSMVYHIPTQWDGLDNSVSKRGD